MQCILPMVHWKMLIWKTKKIHDWYTYARAVEALKAVNDDATIVALRSLAFALQAAANAGILPVKWGGVFGQEFTSALGDAPMVQPLQEESNYTPNRNRHLTT